jgi:SAM-dependent methyltransferase
MALSDVFASNIFVRWLRGDHTRYDLAVTMIGVRMGDRLLVIGADAPALTAALARVAGLSGGASARVTTSEQAASLEAAASEAGVLLDVTAGPLSALPQADGSLDVVVVDAARQAPDVDYDEVARVLRPGGRVIAAIETKKGTPPDVESVRKGMAGSFRAVRVLDDRKGWVFVEALKPGVRA